MEEAEKHKQAVAALLEFMDRSRKQREPVERARAEEVARQQVRAEFKRREEEDRQLRAQEDQQRQQLEAEKAASDAPDHIRRLTRLRELGGNVRRVRGDWAIDGFNSLLRVESAENRPRSSPKTLRADIKRAAEEEGQQGRSTQSNRGAGPFDGLG